MTKTVILQDGLEVGSVIHKEVDLRDLTAGDIIEAREAAERVVSLPNGTSTVVASDVMVGIEILRRRIARLGTLQMPLSLIEFKRLSETDLEILREAEEEMDLARAIAAEERKKQKKAVQTAQQVAAMGRNQGAVSGNT